jgi:hypothetical protein
MRGRFEHTSKVDRNLTVAGYLLRPGQSTPEDVEVPQGQIMWMLDKIRKGMIRFYPANPIARRVPAARPAPANVGNVPYLPPRNAQITPVKAPERIVKPQQEKTAEVVKENPVEKESDTGYAVYYPELSKETVEKKEEVTEVKVERITDSNEGMVKYGTPPEEPAEEPDDKSELTREMLEGMPKRQLVILARDRGIEIDIKLSKSLMIDRLLE